MSIAIEVYVRDSGDRKDNGHLNSSTSGYKITYTLRATASGGNQSYTFSWSVAPSTPTANMSPNQKS